MNTNLIIFATGGMKPTKNDIIFLEPIWFKSGFGFIM